MPGPETQPTHHEAKVRTDHRNSWAKKLIGFYQRNVAAFLCGLLMFCVLIVFLPSLRNDFVNYDDPEYVTDNRQVQKGLTWEGVRWAFVTTEASNWHPLTWLSHMADWQFFGKRSWGHHLSSVSIHALNTGLLFVVLRGMTGALWRSLAVALLFGLHPLRVQSVAWVSERKDVLSALFWMLSLWAYGAYARGSKLGGEQRQSQAGPAGRKISWVLWYLLALVFFALGLLSKPMVVTLPFVLLLLDYWPLARWRSGAARREAPADAVARPANSVFRLVLEKVPFLVLAAAASVVTFLVQQHSGALRPLSGTFTLAGRIENAAMAYCRYLGKFFYPIKLAVFYPHPAFWPVGEVALAMALLLGVSLAALLLCRRHPYVLVGWWWYLGTLVPAIGLVQTGAQAMADRYTYIPLIGIGLLLIWSVGDLTGKWQHRGPKLAVAAGTIAVLCATITHWQIGFWRDSETLFRRSLALTSDNPLARLNLGVALGEKGRPEALEELKAALSLVPNDPDLQFTVGSAMVEAGYSLEAIIPLQQSLAADPRRAQGHYMLARALDKTGSLDEAIFHYRQAVRLKPQLLEAHNDLGLALCNKGQFEEAIDQFKEELRLNPGSAKTHNFLGFAFGQVGRTDEAISQFREAIRIKPDFVEAYDRIGVIFLTSGRLEQAVEQFQRALALNPKYADAHMNLGVTLVNLGDLDAAADQYRQALVLEPSNALAQKNLDLVLSRKRAKGQ